MSELAIDVERIEFGWDAGESLLKIEKLAVARGERVFLKGPSGSGKSTLLALMGGVIVPRSGSIRLLGASLNALSASARDEFRAAHLGFIFQMFNLIPYLSVLENVLLPLEFCSQRRQRMDGAEPRVEALRLLRVLGIGSDELLNRPVTRLSIGQQQRVAAARALIGRPEIIVADEPTSALDADARASFLQLLMSECQEFSSTLLFVSHDASLGALFDRSLSMSEINQARAAAA
jgi:putative ABC transport system ATP-binding protein